MMATPKNCYFVIGNKGIVSNLKIKINACKYRAVDQFGEENCFFFENAPGLCYPEDPEFCGVLKIILEQWNNQGVEVIYD